MRPQPSQPVVVRLPGAQSVPAYIEEADDARITLVLVVRSQPVPAVLGDPATIEYATPAGIHRFEGAIGGRHGATLEVERTPGEEEVIQRRQWARVDTEVPVEVRFHDDESGTAATVVVNLSAGGALIRDPLGLPLGAGVRLRIDLDGQPLEAAGTIVRETQAGDKGIHITAIADRDRERIVRFVAARQRNELARRRRRQPA